MALRNNFRETKKFLISKFDCIFNFDKNFRPFSRHEETSASDLKGSTILWIRKTDGVTYISNIYLAKYSILKRMSVLAVSRKGALNVIWPI